MKTFLQILSTVFITLLTLFAVYFFVPTTFLDSINAFIHQPHFGSTITTINGSDTLSSSRSVINTNFSNLNTDKIELTYSGALGSLTGVGTLVSGTWNATAVGTQYGGTGLNTLTSGQLLYGNGTANVRAVATTSISLSSGLTSSGTLGAQVGGAALTLKQIENRSFMASSTNPTVWVGTTTQQLEVGYGEVWNTVKCYTDVGTLNVQFGYGTASTSLFNASTTVGTITLSGNNTMNSGVKVSVDMGTPASSVTKLTCTVNDTI